MHTTVQNIIPFNSIEIMAAVIVISLVLVIYHGVQNQSGIPGIARNVDPALRSDGQIMYYFISN